MDWIKALQQYQNQIAQNNPLLQTVQKTVQPVGNAIQDFAKGAFADTPGQGLQSTSPYEQFGDTFANSTPGVDMVMPAVHGALSAAGHASPLLAHALPLAMAPIRAMGRAAEDTGPIMGAATRPLALPAPPQGYNHIANDYLRHALENYDNIDDWMRSPDHTGDIRSALHPYAEEGDTQYSQVFNRLKANKTAFEERYKQPAPPPPNPLAGVPEKKVLPPNENPIIAGPGNQPFQNFPDVTTKTLNELEGMSEAHPQHITGIMKSKQVPQAEQNIIQKILDQFVNNPFGKKIPVQEFANRVHQQLTPLTTTSLGPKWREYNALPGENNYPYNMDVYQSPFPMRGNSDFSQHYGSNWQDTVPNAFAHSRYLDKPLIPDSEAEAVAKTLTSRRDTWGDYIVHDQDGRGVQVLNHEPTPEELRGIGSAIAAKNYTDGDKITPGTPFVRHVKEMQQDPFAQKYWMDELHNFPSGSKFSLNGNNYELSHYGRENRSSTGGSEQTPYIEARNEATGEMEKLDPAKVAEQNPEQFTYADKAKADMIRSYAPKERYAQYNLRKTVNDAAKAGAQAVRFPTGPTAMQIEGFWNPRDYLRSTVEPGDYSFGSQVQTHSGDKHYVVGVGSNGQLMTVPHEAVGSLRPVSTVLREIKKGELDRIDPEKNPESYKSNGAAILRQRSDHLPKDAQNALDAKLMAVLSTHGHIPYNEQQNAYDQLVEEYPDAARKTIENYLKARVGSPAKLIQHWGDYKNGSAYFDAKTNKVLAVKSGYSSRPLSQGSRDIDPNAILQQLPQNRKGMFDIYHNRNREYLQKQYGAVSTVKDENGHTWYEIRPNPKEKTRGPEAFGLIPPLALGALTANQMAGQQQKQQ